MNISAVSMPEYAHGKPAKLVQKDLDLTHQHFQVVFLDQNTGPQIAGFLEAVRQSQDGEVGRVNLVQLFPA